MIKRECGRFETPNGSKYLQQLCKHFGHKVEVTYDSLSGTVALPIGPLHLTATDDALLVTIQAEEGDDLARAHHIVDDHLKRFAFREEFDGFDWQPVKGAPA